MAIIVVRLFSRLDHNKYLFIYLVNIRPFWRGGCCRDDKIRQTKGVYFALITEEP